MTQLSSELIAASVFDMLRSMRVAIAALFGCFLSVSAIAELAPRPMPWIEKGREFYSPIQARLWGPGTYSDPLPYTGVYIRVNVSDPYPLVDGVGQQCPTAGNGCGALQPGVWYHVDLRPLGVGTDPATGEYIGADFGTFSGVSIISGGTQSLNASGQTVSPEVHFTFARPDDNAAVCGGKYIGQNLNPLQAGGGVRSNLSTLIPMVDGQYKFCFEVTTVGNWSQTAPSNPAYGVNLTIQTWGIRKPVTQ